MRKVSIGDLSARKSSNVKFVRLAEGRWLIGKDGVELPAIGGNLERIFIVEDPGNEKVPPCEKLEVVFKTVEETYILRVNLVSTCAVVGLCETLHLIAKDDPVMFRAKAGGKRNSFVTGYRMDDDGGWIPAIAFDPDHAKVKIDTRYAAELQRIRTHNAFGPFESVPEDDDLKSFFA